MHKVPLNLLYHGSNKKTVSKCAVILSRSLLFAGKFDERSIYHIYIFVLSENHTTSLRSLEINPNRHFVALLPRLVRLTPFPCFAKGKQTSLRPTPPTKRAAEMISHFCSSFVWMLFSRLQSLAAHPIFLLRISNQVLYLVSSPARHTQ